MIDKIRAVWCENVQIFATVIPKERLVGGALPMYNIIQYNPMYTINIKIRYPYSEIKYSLVVGMTLTIKLYSTAFTDIIL